MGLFRQRKPRDFHHEYMFTDMRKDKLKEVENRAKKDLGIADNNKSADREERIRGAFLNATNYTRRRSERRLSGGFVLSTGIVVVLIILLIIIWKFLLNI